MSNSQEEIAAPKACKPQTPFLLLAAMASIVTASFGLASYLSVIIGNRAFFFCFLISLCAVPIYFFIKTQKKDALKPLAVFGLNFVILGFLAALLLLNNGGLEPFYLVFACIGISAIACAFSVFAFIKEPFAVMTAILCLITCLSVILCLVFKGRTIDNFTFDLWREKSLKLNFKAASLTLWGTVVASLLLVFLVAYIFFIANKKAVITTKYITYAATFAALSVVFKIMGNSITNVTLFLSPNARLTLVYIPWVISGIVLGPFGGMLTAGIGDFLGQILLPSGGAWFWLTGVSNILIPLFPALAYKYLPLKQDWLKILIGMAVSTVICTLGLGTLAICIKYNLKFWETLVTTRWPQLIVIGFNYFLIVSLMPALKQAKITNLKLLEYAKT